MRMNSRNIGNQQLRIVGRRLPLVCEIGCARWLGEIETAKEMYAEVTVLGSRSKGNVQ